MSSALKRSLSGTQKERAPMSRGSKRRAALKAEGKEKDPLAWLKADVAAKTAERNACRALYRRLDEHVKVALQKLADKQLELGILPDIQLQAAPETPAGGAAAPRAKFK
jgi:hypothetical protein